jgi:hypothetical protein
MNHLIEKSIIVLSLIICIFYTLFCPCSRVLYCHQKEVYLLLLFPILYIIITQYLKYK